MIRQYREVKSTSAWLKFNINKYKESIKNMVLEYKI